MNKLVRNINIRVSQKDIKELEKKASKKRVAVSTFCRMELIKILKEN
jgi:predicted DNA binding CopG/RHH family protein